MTIFLLRHGETEWNVARRVQGRSDSPLTARGVAQGHERAARLADEGIAHLVSSPLGRARATAKIVAARLGCAVTFDPDLEELDWGDWTGLTSVEMDARAPGWRDQRRADKLNFRAPGGESYGDVVRRAARARDRLLALPHRAVAAVTHEMLGRTLVGALLRQPADEFLGLKIPHDVIHRFEIDGRDVRVSHVLGGGDFLPGLHRPAAA